MFRLCKQSLYYIILTILVEVCGLMIMGYDNWLNSVKKNYLIIIGSILIYLVIIQLLCIFNKNTMAWILFFITVVINSISLLMAIGKKAPDLIKKIEFKNKSNNNSEELNNQNFIPL